MTQSAVPEARARIGHHPGCSCSRCTAAGHKAQCRCRTCHPVKQTKRQKRAYIKAWQQRNKARLRAAERRYYRLLKSRGICRDCGHAVEHFEDPEKRRVRCEGCLRKKRERRATRRVRVAAV